MRPVLMGVYPRKRDAEWAAKQQRGPGWEPRVFPAILDGEEAWSLLFAERWTVTMEDAELARPRRSGDE